jgi:Cytochrome c554 and c-prime
MRRTGLLRTPLLLLALLLALLGVAAGTLACEGCKTPNARLEPSGDSAGGRGADVSPPTLRLYLMTDPAGALEPCGCVKDQLGGVDHLAAFVEQEKVRAPVLATLSAGPLFFMDRELRSERATQDRARASAMAKALRSLNLIAFAPGENDGSGGKETLATLQEQSGAALVGPQGVTSVLRAVGALKLGLIGIGKTTKEPYQAEVAGAIASLKAQGAQIFIALAAVGRGEAKRLADFVPELTLVLVGAPASAGEANTETPTGERIGNVLIAETGNHVQTVGVLDLFVRDQGFTFQDASSLDQSRKRGELSRRIDALRGSIADLERDKKDKLASTEEQRQELAAAEAQRTALDFAPAPKRGSYARYFTTEIRQSLGSSAAVTEVMREYYKKVNDENKVAFADKKPRPAGDEPAFVGVAACAKCHEDAKNVWDKTAHAHAYQTLSSQFKEFNLDCVSCHVTGYDRPGGSTVAFVEKLRDVQCESCHGPGSKHSASPTKARMPVEHPSSDSCTSCHHPPHVHSFDGPAKLQEILGPGHGRPKG